VKLTASDGAAGDRFGADVAISGDMAVVGAPTADPGGNLSQGAAYVFISFGDTWPQLVKLTASDGVADDAFGDCVDISGLTVIVGAPFDDIAPAINQGSAYVFVRSQSIPNIWTQQAKLSFIDGSTGDQFASSVAIAGNSAIVGAPADTIGTSLRQGSTIVFVRSGSTWQQQERLIAADGAADDQFGTSVGLFGNTAIVGSNGDDIGSNAAQGSAYIFARSGTTWSFQAKLLASDGSAGDQFGHSVGISNETAIVGSPRDTVDGLLEAGSAYVFTRSGSTWVQRQKLLVPNRAEADGAGFSVGISGGLFIVGVPFGDLPGVFNHGYAFVFASNAPFDFDGDGKTDIGVFHPGPAEWWINHSSTGLTTATQFGASTDRFVPGDFTGDGKTDLAVFRPSTGFWFVLRSEDNSFFGFPFGASGDIPIPFNFDGDVEVEPAVFRPSTGTWFIAQYTNSNITLAVQWGTNGDIPVPGNFGIDGSPAIAIYRPSNGQWWLNRNGSQGGDLGVSFGAPGDKPVPGDYTGDGITDIAVFRALTGEWFVVRSENFSFFGFPFGTTGDIPAPGDYDGDSKWDATVFRPSVGTWFSNRSTAGILAQQFGSNGDRPLASAFVP
jgi:hypothetical protein